MKLRGLILLVAGVPGAGGRVCDASRAGAQAVVSGELKQWHDVVLTFDGPMLSGGRRRRTPSSIAG